MNTNNNRRQGVLKGQGVTNEQYLAFKDKVENHGVVRKVATYNDIKIISETELLYTPTGTKFEMSKDAFTNLVKILGLGSTTIKKINATMGNDKATLALIKLMSTALSANGKSSTICMLINKETAKIVGFVQAAQGVLSNHAYFALFEDVLNRHSGMVIKNMAITPEGNVQISVINNDWEFNVAGLNDEVFKSGIMFINTPTATIINPFNERLICTNGMVIAEEGLSLVLKNSDPEKINGFYDTVRNLKGALNFEVEFKSRIIRMINTVASYKELKDVRKSMEYETANIADPDARATIESFVPLMEINRNFLLNRIDLNQVEDKFYKSIRTPMNVWELTNALTDFSSHADRYGIVLKNGNTSVFEMQKVAGQLVFSDYDLESPIKQLY